MRTVRRSFFVVASVVVALLGFGGGVPPADGAEGATCSVTFVILLDPGFPMEPSTGEHYSDGPGVLNCEGAVNGRPITGAGTIHDSGPYGTQDPDSCMSGSEGSGVDHIVLPTADGPVTIDSQYTYTAAKPENGGPFNGQFTGSRFTGTFEFTPLEGDCVTKPVTKIEVKAQGILRD
jgi:hypothetical protein